MKKRCVELVLAFLFTLTLNETAYCSEFYVIRGKLNAGSNVLYRYDSVTGNRVLVGEIRRKNLGPKFYLDRNDIQYDPKTHSILTRGYILDKNGNSHFGMYTINAENGVIVGENRSIDFSQASKAIHFDVPETTALEELTKENRDMMINNSAAIESNAAAIETNKDGIAISLALENPDLVSGESFGIAANWGNFEGVDAFGVTVVGVITDNFANSGSRVAVGGGIGFSTNGSRTVGGRAGMQLTW